MTLEEAAKYTRRANDGWPMKDFCQETFVKATDMVLAAYMSKTHPRL